MSRNAIRAGGLILTVLAVALLGTQAGAGTTGKLSGKVVNEKKEPLPGVNIRIEGQRLGAISDEQGNYFILGITAGTYTVQATLMGEAPFAAGNVVITPDFTTTLNITMHIEAVQLGEVQVEAERPLLQKDATGTTRFLSSQDIAHLPTRGYRDAAAQQTGVVNFQRQIDSETQNSNTLIIRGGRPNETAYFVDGFSQQDPLTGTSSTAINNNAIEEVVLMTGGFAPEYGRIMSGAVNVITREGAKKYFGALEAVTDAVSGQWIGAPVTDYNIYDGSVGGPVLPGHDNLTFYASGERRWQKDRAPTFMPGVLQQELRNDGLDPNVKPNDSSSGWSFQGKLAWQLNDKMSVKAGGLGSQDRWREYSQFYLKNLDHSPRYLDNNKSYFGTFNHVLSSKSFWNLGFNYFQTLRKRGDGVAFDDLSAYYIPTNPRFDTDIPLFYDPGHVVNNYLQRFASYYGIQASMTSQMTTHNQIKVGGDYQRHTLRFFQHYRPTALGGAAPDVTNWDGYGYDLIAIPSPTGTGPAQVQLVEKNDGPDGAKHPQVYSAYAQDKFEREGVIVNAGLRYDYINVDTPALRNDKTPLEDGPNPTLLDPEDLQANKTYSRISPRLGVAFPLDERTILRFNYGQFYQQPNLQDLYPSYRFLEYKINTGGYFVGFGNPNLRPEHTSAYEVGMQRQVGERIRLDMTAYYKDVKDLVEITTIPSTPKSFTTYRNRDYATIKGVDVGFTMRETNHISASINYSLSFAQGTGSVSNTQRNVAWLASEPPKQTSPLDFDQRHKVSMNLDWRLGRGQGPTLGKWHPLEDFGLNALYNIGSGTPYTPTQVYNEITLANVSALLAGPLNSRYGPWTQTMDLKATRGFELGGSRFEGFLWVLNVFDIRNAHNVYTSTGSPQTTGWLNTDDGQAYLLNASIQGKDGLGQYELAQNDPGLYGNPRLVRFGLRTSF
jgi:outer membrane receptor protein involved in Fe transport